MARSGREQSKHDSVVRKTAQGLEKAGWKVKADVKGYRKPDTIGGYRPDVTATKGGERKIVEVETPTSVDSARDKGQQKAFRQAADRSRNTSFTRKLTR